jgi:hypothetical protein
MGRQFYVCCREKGGYLFYPEYVAACPIVHMAELCSIDVMASWEPQVPISLTASPYLLSKLDICYRTLPYTHEDKRLRPDLRLGSSDVAVRKVAALVKWFEGIAGLASS